MNDILKRITDELKRDKKKTAILSTLLLVAVIVGIKSIGGSNVPAPAAAVAVVTKDIAKADSHALVSAGDMTNEDNKRTKYIEQVDRTIRRDLFAINLKIFQLQEPEVVKAPQPTTATRPAEVDLAEIERRTIEADAKSLSLISTMVGPNSTAIVNSSLLRVGEKINDFEVIEIASGFCTVQKKDVKIKLVMKGD